MRGKKRHFVQRATAVLLSAILTAGLFWETGLIPVEKVYAEEENPPQGEEQPDVPIEGEEQPDVPPQREEQPDVPAEGEEQPDVPTEGEEQPEELTEPEKLPQETVSENALDENTLEAVAPLRLEAAPREAHNHDGISYTAWERTDSLPDQAGNYYLTENVNLTTKWQAPAGTVNLCLNGKTITQTAAEADLQPVIYIENGTFGLYDCDGGGKITGGQDGGVQVVSARLNMYGGEVSGNCIHINADGRHIGRSPAGGISLDSGSNMNMYGGKIANNSGRLGGGIFVENDSCLTLVNGEISHNRCWRGGGVYVSSSDPGSTDENRHGKFVMNGGRIANNETYWETFSGGRDDAGGGVFNYGMFVLNNGEITGNKSGMNGGGVAAGGIFTMNGGRIADNDLTEYQYGAGAGVYVNNYMFTMNGGEITGNRACRHAGVFARGEMYKTVPTMTVGGNAKIYGNYDENNNDSNVILMLTGYYTQNIIISESNPLTEGASVGVHIIKSEDERIGGDVTEANSADYSRYFFSDDTKFEIQDSGADHIIQLAEEKSHNWATDWSSDDTNHWHACLDADCGEKKDEAAHMEDGGTRTKEPTETETGTITYRCSVCGYEMRTEEIPATGEVQTDVAVDVDIAPGAPDTGIITPSKEELMDFITPLLTEEERRQIEAGTDVKLTLSVQSAESSVSDTDKAVITAALDGSAVGQYLEITLKKAVGTTETQLYETGEKIRLTIHVPENLKNTDADRTRTFAVIRVHNGTAAVLNDLDDSADTITIETDRFSTYAIVYKDVADGGGTGSGDSGAGSGGTGSGSGTGGGTGSGSGAGGGTGSGSGTGGGTGSGSGAGGGTGSGSGAGGGTESGSDSSGAGSNSVTISGGSDGNSVTVRVNAENSTGDGSNSSETGENSNAGINNGNSSMASASDGKEPKTGDSSSVRLYATAAMIVGFIYLLLYFADRARGMTEHEKDVFVAAFIRWAKKGGIFRKICAFAAIFVLLAYYHGIGKRTAAAWREVYGA